MKNNPVNEKAKAIPCSYLFDNSISGNAAVFCSDERFIDESISFLKDSLKLKRFDLIVTAGGPAFITAGAEALMYNLELLIDEHNIKRLILISHNDCKYYKKKFKDICDSEIAELQKKDLTGARAKIADLFPGVETETYFADVQGKKVTFECINHTFTQKSGL